MGINKIYEWSKTLDMEVNGNKCNVLEMGKSETRPTYTYKVDHYIILRGKEEKNL